MQYKNNHKYKKIFLRNFGPIIECELEIRPLTVLLGPGNTGKSYVATLLYALHSSFNNQSSRNHIDAFEAAQLFKDSFGASSDQKLEEVKSSLKESLSEFDEARSKKKQNGLFILREPAIRAIETTFEGSNDKLKREIERCFGTSIQDLVRYRSRGASNVSVSSAGMDASEEQIEFTYDLKQNSIASSCPVRLPLTINDGGIPPNLRRGLKRSSSENDPRILGGDMGFWFAFEDLLKLTQHSLVDSFIWPAHYLPADRTGLLGAHAVLVGSLIERAATTGLLPSVSPPLLKGTIADFLEKLIVRKPLHLVGDDLPIDGEVASAIEDQLIKGSILYGIDQLTGNPKFQFLPRHWKHPLPLLNSSSMVSELAPVVMFLRDHVHSQHFVIIEEPESHLHPAKQVEFIRLLVKLIDYKVRVVLITHSEWIIDELANIVSRAKNLSSRSQFEDHSKVSIPASQVGVWYFHPKTRKGRVIGSQVKEIKINDSGFYPTDFDDVARELHNDWIDTNEEYN